MGKEAFHAAVHGTSRPSVPGPWSHLALLRWQGSVGARQPHWQDLQEVWDGGANYNMEKYTECKKHKIGFEILRVFFSPPCWAATLNILGVCFMFMYKGCVYTVQLHTFQSIGQSVQLLPFFLPSQFQVWIFWGRFEVCSASQQRSVQRFCRGRHKS